MDKPELVYLKQIGDPEKIENYGKVEQGGESIRYIRKSVHIFRNPIVEHQARLLKSKSEGNLNELVEKEPKPSFLQSIYKRGLMTRSKKQEKDLRKGLFHQSSPCLVSTVSDIGMTEQAKETTFKKISCCQEEQMQSLPLFCESRGESLNSYFIQQPIFFCFTAGSRPIMPNHKTVHAT